MNSFKLRQRIRLLIAFSIICAWFYILKDKRATSDPHPTLQEEAVLTEAKGKLIDEKPDISLPRTSKAVKLAKPALQKPRCYSADGPGELGAEVIYDNLSSEEMRQMAKNLYIYGVNVFVSDKISLHRSLKDHRDKSCIKRSPFNYSKLPSTSVIIVFHNEAWSILLRTIYSVLHYTADAILKEIILVDDYSYIGESRMNLKKYIRKLPKVRLIRTKKHKGLLQSRQIGLAQATGKVVAFISSHCECTAQWLEPLLKLIAEDYRTIAVPSVYDIDHFTLAYNYNDEMRIGGFTWNMEFRWRSLSSKEADSKRKLGAPYATPTFNGTYVASSQFLSQIEYKNMPQYAQERNDLELSFRTWMSKGRVMIHPCSHIGQVAKIAVGRDAISIKHKNSLGTILFWLGSEFLSVSQAHVVARKKTNKIQENNAWSIHRNRYESFSWYLKNVFPEKYVPDLKPGYYGNLESMGVKKACLDTDQAIVDGDRCSSRNSQLMELNSRGHLRNGYDNCVIVDELYALQLRPCPTRNTKSQSYFHWIWQSGLFIHSDSNLCLQLMRDVSITAFVSDSIIMKSCDHEKTWQLWNFTLKYRR